jgi:flagellar basal body-associated protein FliL
MKTKAPKRARGVVAVIMALAVAIGVITAILMANEDKPVSALGVEALAILALVAGGLIAWLSASDKGADDEPDEDAHPGKPEDEWPGR